MSAPSAKNPIRVLLVEDSPIIRLGLRSALEDHADITIVGEAGTAAAGLDAVTKLKPDVVMLDLNLPDKSGLVACRDFLRVSPELPVLILTSSSSERNMHEAISAGARGYLLQKGMIGTIPAAGLCCAVFRGEPVLDPSMSAQVLNLVRHRGSPSAAEKLAAPAGVAQEHQPLWALLAGGRTNKEIGEQLGLTEKTVKNYLATIFSKLNITRR